MEHDDAKMFYEWVPKIRILLVDNDGREFNFPQVGRWLAQQDTDSFMTDGALSRRQCKSLWRWLERDDEPPARLWIMVNKEDLLKAFPELPKS